MQMLAAADSLDWAAAAGKLALGLPLCLVAPCLFTVLLKVILHRWGGDWLPGFWVSLLLVSLVVVPMLMLTERRTRGEFLNESLEGQSNPFAASSYGEYQVESTRFMATSFTEVALQGPRLLWGFIDTVRGKPAGDATLRAAAAGVVVELFDAGQGLPVKPLLRPDRPPPVLDRVIRYLLKLDWIGVSGARDRVWLLTPARERLGGVLRSSR
jgi:hypothetical protein